jgi:hypothetical protein
VVKETTGAHKKGGGGGLLGALLGRRLWVAARHALLPRAWRWRGMTLHDDPAGHRPASHR